MKEQVLQFEPLGASVVVDPFYPPTVNEEKASKMNIFTGSEMEITDKNRFWPQKRSEMKHRDFASHPCQGRVVAIGPIAKNDLNIGTLKVGDWIAFRVSSGEELVYGGIVYRRLAVHEILIKYLDETER